MSRNIIETIMGAVVLSVAALFLVFAYTNADLRQVQGYQVDARFAGVAGLTAGNDVRITGVRVGSVTSIELDPQTYLAVVRMTIDPSVTLTTDASARIASESLLGGRFISIDPGGAEEVLAAGGRIQYTEPALDIEQLLRQAVFGLQAGDEADGGDAGGW